ncbi:MAG: Rpn family recombination-promoting nuclease/putative transposase [Bacilli bacterium]
MENTRDKVKLDEVLKYLFSTSNKVLIKLLNGVFDEDFKEDEVSLTVSNNEFIEDTLDVIRGDMFFEIKSNENKKACYHLEFQTKNDSSMVVRMFEYGFKKGKENSGTNLGHIKTIYLPKQKVIFFEENKNIKDYLELNIVFPSEESVLYRVDVMKYWEFTDEELIRKKMYPLIPLQLFNLRKELQKAQSSNDMKRMNELSHIAKSLAIRLANESKELFDNHEILGEDFHRMLLAINNLIEYLNRNYLNDNKLEDEVNTMTKTLYDPEVEKRGIEKGIQQGMQQGMEKGIMHNKLENAKNLLDVLDDETISIKLGLELETVKKLRLENMN